MSNELLSRWEPDPFRKRSIIADNVDLQQLIQHDMRDIQWMILDKVNPPERNDESLKADEPVIVHRGESRST